MGFGPASDAARPPEAGLRLQVFGTVRLVGVGGDEIALPRHARRVLAAIAFGGRRPSTLERLIDLLWDADPPATARQSIRNAVGAVRRAVGTDVIETVDGGYKLADTVALDRLELAELASATGATPARRSDALLRVIDGEPWADLGDHLDVSIDRRVVERERVLAWVGGSAPYIDHDPAAALMITERLAHQATTDESLAGLHASLAARCGRRDDALRIISATRSALISIGLDTGPELRELEQGILADSSPAGGVEPDQPGRPAESRPATFVGRAAELAQLDALAPTRERFATALVQGPPGIGKSTLVRRWADRLANVEVFDATCAEHGGGPLTALANAFGLDEMHGGELRRVLAAAAPAVLIIDDLQWAREATAATIAALIDRDPPNGLTVIAVARPIADEPPSVHLVYERITRTGTVIDLGPLDHDELLDLSIVHDARADAATVERLAARSGGYPLIATMLLRAEDGSGGPRSELDRLVASQLAQLDDDAASLVRWAAVCDGPQPVWLLGEAAAIKPDLVASAAELATLQGLGRELPGGRFHTAHDTIRDSVVRSLSTSRVAEMHTRMRDLLWVGEHPNRWAAVAYHAIRSIGADAERTAAEAARKAAEHALARMSPLDALSQMREMLGVLDGDRQPRLRAEVLVQAAQAAGWAFNAAARDEYAEEALTLARRYGFADVFAGAVAARSRYQVQGRADAETWKQLTEALEMVAVDDLPNVHADVLGQLSVYYATTGPQLGVDIHELALDTALSAVTLAERGGDPIVRLWCREALVIGLYGGCNFAQQIEVAESILELGSGVGPQASMSGTRWRAIPQLALGDRHAFADALDQLERVAANYPVDARISYGSYAAQWRAMEQLIDGNWSAAASSLDRLLAEYHDLPNNSLGSVAQYAWLAIETGQVESVIAAIEDAASADPGLVVQSAFAALGQAMCGDEQAARAWLAGLVEPGLERIPRDITFTASVGGIAETIGLLGDRDAAAQCRDLLVDWHGTVNVVAGGLCVMGAAELSTAIMAATLDDPLAEELFEQAADVVAPLEASAVTNRTRAWRARFGLDDPVEVAEIARATGQLALLRILAR